MKRFTLALVFFFIMSIQAHSQMTWTAMTDFPQGRYAPYAFMLGNRFFLGGGAYQASPVMAANDLMEYNFSTDQWETRASLPAGVTMYDERQFVIGGMGYTSCGQLTPLSAGYMSSLYRYNPAQDSWTALAPFPGTPRYTPYAFSIGNYGYMGMGFSPYERDFWKYDPDADVWTAIDSFPGAARQTGIAFVINGVAYVGLGASNYTYCNDMYRYDTTSGHWTQIANFPGSARVGSATMVMNNIAYVIGGVDSNQIQVADIWSFDPATDTWALADTFSGLAMGDVVAGSNSTFAVAGTGRDVTGNFSGKVFKTGIPTGINELKSDAPKIWSNSDHLHIAFAKPLTSSNSLDIYDMQGRKIADILLAKNETSFDIDLSNNAAGLYLYDLRSADAITAGKIVIANR